MSTAASNSIMTVSRAKYGKRLRAADYRAMAGMKTVADVAGYLKTRTRYSAALSAVNENSVHRANLENALQNYNINEVYEMCRFERSLGSGLFRYIIKKYESDLLKSFLVYFKSGKNDLFLASLPMSVNKFSTLDFEKMCSFREPFQIAEYLTTTDYAFLKQDISDENGIDLTLVEAKLDRSLFKSAADRLGPHTKSNGLDIYSYLEMRAQLYDFLVIYRSKKYYDCTPLEITPLLINLGGAINQKTMREMVNAENSKKAADIFLTTKYGKNAEKYGFDRNIEKFCNRIINRYIEKSIHFSADPMVVTLAYIIFSEVEANNVINIAEGVRYGLSPEAILENIVTPEE